jgi:hypothetical protein
MPPRHEQSLQALPPPPGVKLRAAIICFCSTVQRRVRSLIGDPLCAGLDGFDRQAVQQPKTFVSAAIPALVHSSFSSAVAAPLTPQPPSTTPSSTMGRPPRCPLGGTTLANGEIRNPLMHRSGNWSLGPPIIAAEVATPREDRSTSQPTQPSIRLNAISRPSLSQTATLILALSRLARWIAPLMILSDFKSVSIEVTPESAAFCLMRTARSSDAARCPGLGSFYKCESAWDEANEYNCHLRAK